jgi:hypothetical protein
MIYKELLFTSVKHHIQSSLAEAKSNLWQNDSLSVVYFDLTNCVYFVKIMISFVTGYQNCTCLSMRQRAVSKYSVI